MGVKKSRFRFLKVQSPISEKGAREKIDHLNKSINETELSRQNAITHWQQEAENIRQNYRVSVTPLFGTLRLVRFGFKGSDQFSLKASVVARP